MEILTNVRAAVPAPSSGGAAGLPSTRAHRGRSAAQRAGELEFRHAGLERPGQPRPPGASWGARELRGAVGHRRNAICEHCHQKRAARSRVHLY